MLSNKTSQIDHQGLKTNQLPLQKIKPHPHIIRLSIKVRSGIYLRNILRY